MLTAKFFKKGVHNRQHSQNRLLICQERPTGELKMYSNNYLSAPGPAGGAYSTPQTSQLVERGLASSLLEPNTCYDLTVK